ncbi:MAG TPA: magnesium/cobalt transporter CorA [Terriglobales bacterium]|nr:magnesium/cobalt transporter CorA [Terriglobales bacterium]
MSTLPTTPQPQLAWIEIEDPASPQLDQLAQRYTLHPLQIEDCRHRPQRAKYEEHDLYLFCVLKQIHNDDVLTFTDLDAFIGKDFLITVAQGHTPLIDKVHRRISDDGTNRLDKALYYLVDTVVDEYSAVVDLLAEETSDLEDNVLINPGPEKLQIIFRLKRKLVEFRRIASGMRELVNALMRKERGIIGDDLDPYFRDVYDHLVRIVDLIETYRDLLTGSLDIYLSAVANRTNNVMKVLTIWGTIALPLVIITSFFGMNLKLPWEDSPHGLWYAGGLMALSTICVLLFFRRKGWY